MCPVLHGYNTLFGSIKTMLNDLIKRLLGINVQPMHFQNLLNNIDNDGML